MIGHGDAGNATAPSFAIWNAVGSSVLLPNREPATVKTWLAGHPGIEIIARDRSGGYSKAAADGASKATQVADRWHFMANASAAFLEAVRRSMRKIRDAIGAVEIDPALLTSAERRQFEGAKRREAINAAILSFAKAGVPIKEIVRRTGYSHGTVRRVVRGGRTDIFRTRESSPDLLQRSVRGGIARRLSCRR